MLSDTSSLKRTLRKAARNFARSTGAFHPLAFPTFSGHVRERIDEYPDYVRYSTLALSLERIVRDNVPGALAEVGVYRGVTSAFIHHQVPDRHFYLFDTFEGFPEQDLDGATRDERFKDTSEQGVAQLIGDTRNIEFRTGYFPETAVGLEDEQFALVMLDVDLYKPALEVFRFFYPRMARGGYFFAHDYNSPESAQGTSRAAHEFMTDKQELLIEIPDQFGSVMFRKM